MCSSGAHPRTRIPAFLAALCATLALGVPSSASAVQLRGVDVHVQAGQIDNDPTLRDQEFAMLQAAGATSVRFDLIWATVEWNAKGQDDPNVLANIDSAFAQARAHGLKVILDLWATPCWASSAPPTMTHGCTYGWWENPVTHYPPVNAQDYADMATFAVKRWGSDLAALELWNEPNGGQFFTSPHPAFDYARLLKAVYPAVKTVAPNLPVIISLGGTDTQWLTWLYGYGVQGYYDGIAVHPYDQPTLSGLRAFHAFQLSHGDHTPLWVTEVGWSSSVSGLQGQASGVSSVLQQLAALPYVAAAEIYDMHDGGTDPNNAEDHFGLFDYTLHPKPAWAAFYNTLHSLNEPPAVPAPARQPKHLAPNTTHHRHKHHKHNQNNHVHVPVSASQAMRYQQEKMS